jgi:tetratricopeptide (TPR) repeat protein
MATGDVLQASNRCDEAIVSYERVPENLALRRNADLQIAACLQDLDKPDKAVRYVERVLNADPSDVEAAVMLGDIYRAIDKFAQAADAYGRGIKAIKTESADDWRIYYYRGVAEERSKQWPKAEADFQHALKLSPGQASVLNYLGYSWVDMGTNLDKALAMIKQAVDARPNDGYIVDSLGWAYYRLHRYKDAVATLERAIELKPEDSTINDHLGDAYWQVGRKLEATFQWAHARDMNPEPGQLPAILDKLKHGLKAAANGTASKASAVGTPGAAADPKAHSALPQSITVGAGESLWDIAAKVYGNSDMYLRIYDANRDRIHDPDRIFPGMTLNLPAVGAN